MEAETSSRDLLQRFAGSTTISGHLPTDSGEEIELGLSLGGGFSSNPREKKTNLLIRSSSISSFPFSELKQESESVNQVGGSHLQRTCSLPVPGADEDYRKRKLMQSLKRMEAKRKRFEKRFEKRNGLKSSEEHGQCTGSRRGLPPLSQGSVGSSSSVGGGTTMQGFETVRVNKLTDTKGLSRSKSDLTANLRNLEDENTKKSTIERSGSGVGDMPFVSTRGIGPHGKRIEGFLYKYRKGEEVRIVCVCHGKFLTPAEFVRHAGGGDVDHPLKHIVVTPSPSSSTSVL